MIKRILTIDNPQDLAILRAVAAPVPDGHIGTTHVQRIITDLKDTLVNSSNGIAIAAPQIGESVRIFVVSPQAFGEDHTDFLVCINPKISRFSKERKDLEEGCLSIPNVYGNVTRSVKVTLDAYNEHGQAFRRGASGLLAQIFQHETDHLDGILFTDSATDVRDSNDARNDSDAVAEADTDLDSSTSADSPTNE